MKKIRAWNKKKIAVCIMIGLSLSIFMLGQGLRLQIQYQREFLESEIVTAVHELNQLQREVLRLNRQVSLLPATPPNTLKLHIDLAQSRMLVIQNRLQARRDRHKRDPRQAELVQDAEISSIITTWSNLKPQLETLTHLSTQGKLLAPSDSKMNQQLSEQLVALELKINQVVLSNREQQWTLYQSTLDGQKRSLNYLMWLLASFFLFALLFGLYAIRFIETRQRLLEEMRQMSTTDELTQIANRRCFNQVFYREWNRMLRAAQPIALILCDIDFFKQYNDYYGHQAGDQCLHQVAQALAESVRRSGEFVARYGGEEFVIVIANTTPDQIEGLIARLQIQIRQLTIAHARSSVSAFVTMSMGVAIGVPNFDLSPEIALKYADEALYKAKSQGRNQSNIHLFNPQTLPIRPPAPNNGGA